VNIHPTAIIDPSARLGQNTTIGPYSIVGPDVIIGDEVRIANGVLIEKNTRVGSGCRISSGAVLGTDPQDLKYQGETTYLEVGNQTIIREYVTINLGTGEKGKTVIGSHAMLLAYAHVAHDCRIGDHVILANAVNVAGHAEIEEYAFIGGLVGVHQFVKIGRHAMIGGGFRVTQDICPYVRVAGYPLKVTGLNLIGLERRGFTPDAIAALKEAYKILFRNKLNVSQAIQRISTELPRTGEIEHILQFIAKSERGLIR
jgi:UDP-N-acetylglucosamine acyltransferase